MMKKWTEEELELLKREYATSTNEKLCELFPDRTPLSVYKKAKKLGFYKTKEIEFINRSNANKGEKCANWKGGIRKTSKGYLEVLKPNHPRADSNGYVMQHIVVFEEATGVSVPENCVIHHINGNKRDNRIVNLCMMEKGAHTAFHHIGTKRSKETGKLISEKAKKRLSDKRNHPSYKEVDVDEMIRLKETGMMVKDIAKLFNINRSTVWSKIKERENG